MYFSHVLLTFKEKIESAKDIDHDDIITKNVENLFSYNTINYMKYLKSSNHLYLKVYNFYKILRIISCLILISLLEYLDVTLLILITEISNILFGFYIDKNINYYLDQNNLNKVIEYSNKSIYYMCISNPLFILTVILKINYFPLKYNLLTYQYYILTFKFSVLIGALVFIKSMIYNLKYKSCIKIRNKLEEHRSYLFNSNYTHIIRSNNFFAIHKIVNLKTKISKLKSNHCCAICRQDYCEKDYITELPCKHFYHKDCIKLWLNKEFTCPYCRKIVF